MAFICKKSAFVPSLILIMFFSMVLQEPEETVNQILQAHSVSSCQLLLASKLLLLIAFVKLWYNFHTTLFHITVLNILWSQLLKLKHLKRKIAHFKSLHVLCGTLHTQRERGKETDKFNQICMKSYFYLCLELNRKVQFNFLITVSSWFWLLMLAS